MPFSQNQSSSSGTVSNPATGAAYITETHAATASQTVFNLTNTYRLGMGNLEVYVNGMHMTPGVEYAETTTTSITFTTGLSVDDDLTCVIWKTNIATSGDALTMTYTPAGVGAVATTVHQQLRNLQSWTVNVKDAPFYAKGDGVTDDTVAINTANTAATSVGKKLAFPAGTYIATAIPLIAGQQWVGESNISTIIKQKSGTNADFITSATNTIDDVRIESMTINGNSVGNTTGDTLNINGASPVLKDLTILNSPGTALQTAYNAAERERVGAALGYFSNIVIDSSKKHGWLHNGSSDSHFNKIEIIDSGLSLTNTYYGFSDQGSSGNGRFFDFHAWNRSTTTIVPASSFNCATVGNTFSGCQFRGSNLPLTITGSGNTFSSCTAYGTRGTYCVNLASAGNALQMAIGLAYYPGNPTYMGIYLSGGNNVLDLVNVGSGCTLGVVDFSNDPGGNIVRIGGYQTTGSTYANTPAASSEVTLAVQGGATPSTFRQFAGIPWTSYTPTVTSITGSFTTVSATGSYTLVGKTCHFRAAIVDTTNGTAGGGMNVSLPFAGAPGKTFVIVGRAIAISGSSLIGTISASATTCSVFAYNNTFPGLSGETLTISGTYEIA